MGIFQDSLYYLAQTASANQIIPSSHNNLIIQEMRAQKQSTENTTNRNLGGFGITSEYIALGAIKSQHIDRQIAIANLLNPVTQIPSSIVINGNATTGNTGNFTIVWETLDMRAILWVTAQISIEVPNNCSYTEFNASLELYYVHSGVTYGPIAILFDYDTLAIERSSKQATGLNNNVLTKTITYPFLWSPAAIEPSTAFFFRSTIINNCNAPTTGYNARFGIKSVIYETFFRIHA